MNLTPKKHNTDFPFLLLLFGIFASLALLTVILGARVYQTIAVQTEISSSTGTALGYLAEKIRQNDSENALEAGYLEDTPALIIHSTEDGIACETYLYAWEGSLRELFVRKSQTPSPDMGSPIMELQDFTFEKISDSLYFFSVTETHGESLSLYISPKCAG